MTIPPTTPDGTWLQVFLLDAVHRNLCTEIHCTTCGALEFRRGLLVALEAAMGGGHVSHYDNAAALAITRALACVDPETGKSQRFEAAVRTILFDVWQVAAQHEVEAVLQGTWAGDVLAGMKTHHKAREEERRAFAESQDPVKVQKRREENRRLKQEKHRQRLAKKVEYDRLWYDRLLKENRGPPRRS